MSELKTNKIRIGGIDYEIEDTKARELIKNLNKETIETWVEEWGYTKNTGNYSKPVGGIPKSDLINSVQVSLEKANTALQEEQYKGTVTGIKIGENTLNPNFSGIIELEELLTSQDINGKQDILIDGENIKTINGESILGGGNITIQGGNIAEVDGDTLDKGNLILKPKEIISFKTPLQNDSIVITGFEETIKDGLISSFDEYFLVFRTAANSTCSITLPSNIYWAGGEIPVIGDTEEVEYELSITRRKLNDNTSSYKAVLVSFKIVQS